MTRLDGSMTLWLDVSMFDHERTSSMSANMMMNHLHRSKNMFSQLRGKFVLSVMINFCEESDSSCTGNVGCKRKAPFRARRVCKKTKKLQSSIRICLW